MLNNKTQDFPIHFLLFSIQDRKWNDVRLNVINSKSVWLFVTSLFFGGLFKKNLFYDYPIKLFLGILIIRKIRFDIRIETS